MEEEKFSRADKIRGYIFALTVLEAPVFFATYAIIGKTYEGSESTPVYAIYMAVLLVIQVFYFLKRRRITKREFMWLIVPILFVAFAWLFAKIYRQEVNSNNLRNIILWQYTGMLLAMNVNTYKVDKCISNSLIVLMLVITVGAILTILIPFLRGRSLYVIAGHSLTGSTFQAQSYYVALSVGINLFLFSSSNSKGNNKILTYIILGVQFFCSILYAGRGGMVLALVYVAIYYMHANKKDISASNRLLKAFAFISAVLVVFLVLGHIIESNSILQQRFGRVFSYIGSGGIDLAQTSNRDILYTKALGYIGKSPLFGYGILGYEYLDGLNRYPHNIALEILLEGGIVYLLLWLFIVISGYRKMKRIRNSNLYKLYLIVFMFSIVKLMFSSSYSYEMLFWFSIVFSHICNRNREEVPTE